MLFSKGNEKLTPLAVVELEVPHGILLIPHAGASFTAVEREVRHESSAALFDEQPNVNHVWSCRHVEDDVLQAGRLRCGPVHTRRGSSRGDGRGVEDEVAYLPEENIHALPVLITMSVIYFLIGCIGSHSETNLLSREPLCSRESLKGV